MTTLDLGIVGNCCIGALIDGKGRIVWCCFPRFDSDPVFCLTMTPIAGSLRSKQEYLSNTAILITRLYDGVWVDDADSGFFAIELDGFARAEQEYLSNTAILITRLYDGFTCGSGMENLGH